jgi:hypothetical protein
LATRERAAIRLVSNVGSTVSQIAAMWLTDESRVRTSSTSSTSAGPTSLDPDYRGGVRAGSPAPSAGGRSRRRCSARHRGVALTRWWLPRLADHLRDSGVVELSPAQHGPVLAAAGLSGSAHAHLEGQPRSRLLVQAARILALKTAPPTDGGHVIAFDQMGPVGMRPTAGSGCAPGDRPERQRATYHKRHDTHYVLRGSTTPMPCSKATSAFVS